MSNKGSGAGKVKLTVGLSNCSELIQVFAVGTNSFKMTQYNCVRTAYNDVKSAQHKNERHMTVLAFHSKRGIIY